MSGYARAYKRFTKPPLLTAVALVLLVFPDSAPLFTAVVLAASAAGLSDLYRMIMRVDTIRFSSTLAISILLGYGLGSVIYLVAHGTFHAAKYQNWAYQGLLFDQAGLSMALAASLLASAVLYARAGFERPADAGLSVDSLAGVKAERLVWLGVAVAALALYAGGVGYMGAFVSETRHVSTLGAIANLLVPPLVPYTFLLTTSQRSLSKKAALIAALLFFVGVLFLLGRRYLLYVVLLSAIALRMRGYRFTNKGVTVAVFSILAVAVLYWGFNFFMALRMAVGEAGRDASLLELVRSALSQLGGAHAGIVRERLAENVGSRPFILSYLAGLMGITSGSMPAFGKEFFYSLQMSVPSVVMPWKVATLSPSAEALVHPLYGIPVFDGPNSYLVTGFDDFGFIGAFVYPLGVALLYYWFYKGLRTVVRDPATRLFVLFTLLLQLFYIEQGFSAVFVTLRNLIIVIGIAWCLKKPPAVQLARQRVKVNMPARPLFWR